MQPKNLFYRMYGVRTPAQIRTPKVVALSSIEVPRAATFYSLDVITLDKTIPPYNMITDDFFVYNITELTSKIASPMEHAVSLTGLRKRIREMGGRLLTESLEFLKSAKPVAVNASVLKEKYRYRASPVQELDEYSNYIQTIIDSASNDTSERTLIITVPVDDNKYDKQWLKFAANKPKLWLKNNVQDPSAQLWIELNKYWLGEESWFTPLKHKDVIFIFHRQDSAVVMHNAAFLVLDSDADLKDESNGLITSSMHFNEVQVRSLIPTLRESLMSSAPDLTVTSLNAERGDTLDDSTVGIPPDAESELERRAGDDKVLKKLISVASETPDPFTGKSLTTIDKATVEELKIPTKEVTDKRIDPSLRDITSTTFDTLYLTSGQYNRDIANAIKGILPAGILITNIELTHVESVLGDSEVIKVSTRGLDGTTSPLLMTIPTLNPDGSYTVDNTNYRMRKQHVEAPIVKVSSSKVILSSYFGTLFITRSTKAVDDIGRFLVRIISTQISSSQTMSGLAISVFDREADVPKLYAKLSQSYEVISDTDYRLYLNYPKRDTQPLYDKSLEKTGNVWCGVYKGSAMAITPKNELIVNGESIGSLLTLFGIPENKLPTEFAQMKVMGVEIPVGVFLGSRIGLSSMLRAGCKYQFSTEGRPETRLLTFRFKDVKVYVTEFTNPSYELILNSLTKMDKVMSRYSMDTFDQADVYQLWVEEQGLAIRYYNEFEHLDNMFIDDVSTRGLLAEMNEPTEFKALVIRACELLNTEKHSRPGDGKLMRIRGNERIPGFIYKALSVSVRGYKNSTNPNKRKLELAPWEVFNMITGDNSVKPVENNNPIQYVKERETVTLAGQGGRNSEALSMENRLYDPNDVGFIGEASTDNGSVGMVAFLTASPKIGGLRGTNASEINDTTEDPAACYTTSYMLAPGIQKDHMPRVSFVNIQNTHNININGVETPYVRTGYEYVFPLKAGKAYAWMAKGSGEVTKKTADMIVVKYADGTIESGPLGIVPGTSGDKTYPHNIITHLKTGDKFNEEAAITYNDAFFKQDDLYPDLLCYVQAKMVDTALLEDLYTHEDSCTLSDSLVPAMTTKKLAVKSLVLNASDEISEVRDIGDYVSPETVIMTITDAIGTYATGSSKQDALKELMASVPKAGVKGKVIDIEVLYYSDLEDLSPSIQMLIATTDTRLKIKRQAQGKKPVTGQIGHGHRINGNPMLPGTLEVKYYILSENGVTRGDKFVFGNQLKATVGKVFPDLGYTTNGISYEATFGYRSVLARIVQSYQDGGAYARFMEFLGHYLAKKLGV
jgi:hypothetical protein